jgi:hypothetical protein
MNGRYQVSARLNGSLGLKYHPPDKTNTISLFWKISSYLIICVTEIIKVDCKPEVRYVKKMVKDLAFRRGCRIGGTQRNALGTVGEGHWQALLTYAYFDHCFRFPHFQHL